MNRITTVALLAFAFVLGPSIDPAPVSAAPAAKVAKKKTRKSAKKKKKRANKRQKWPVRRPKAKPKKPPKLGNVPFQEGERLAFKIRMLGADAGEAVLAVGKRTKVNGRSVVPLVAFLRSSDFLSKFYPVDNKLVVVVDEKTFQPLKTDFYIRENGKAIDYHTTFDQRARWVKSTRKKNGKTLKRNFTPAGAVYEALSSVYGARRMDLQPGQVFQYYVWDGRKERLVTITAKGVEKVWTPSGWYDAMRLDVSSTITGGFIKSKLLDTPAKTGSAWFGLDPHRTPVKLVTPTKLGDAEAMLVRRYVEKV